MICPVHNAPYDEANPCLRCQWAEVVKASEGRAPVCATELPPGGGPDGPGKRSGNFQPPVANAGCPDVTAGRDPHLSTAGGEGLLDFIVRRSPEFRRPTHLADWCALLERAAYEAVRGLCEIPIRHYKTETTVHGIVWLLHEHPDWRIIFLTHSFEAAQKWGKRIRQLAEGTPIGPTKGWNTIAEWRNEAGGGVVVMSADQSKIGYDCNALIVDDPIDEHGSEDVQTRDAVDNTIAHYTARCMYKGRRGPVLIVASPFHPDNPIARRLLRHRVAWVHVHHAAIEYEGQPGRECAFAPEVWPLDELKRVRAELAEKDPTERLWWAQFMCDPRPPGADLFKDPTRYTALPEIPFRIAYGADFAFTQGSGSDYFALVVARLYGRKAYVTEVQRHKIDAHQIESTLRAAQNRHGRGVVWSYQSGPEVGLTNILVERGLPIARMPARYNKLVRAERTVKRWNDGDVLVPHESVGAPWTHGFLARVGAFRGRDKDGDDDEIDALVSLCDGALGGAVAVPTSLGRPGYSGL